MCGLIVKCAVLIVLIHIIRALGRLAGPRFSGLALGLPSTTAVVLISCGCEQGSPAATEMAASSLLGLVAAVVMPLAYIQSVRLRWPLLGAIAASVGGYLLLATGLGCLPQIGALPRVFLATAALISAAIWVRERPVPPAAEDCARVPLSTFRTMFLRTATPAIYVLMLGSAEHLAGPSWAGLVSTFPSMSLVVLIVTHLEAGPAEARRIAQVLPSGNTSTLAFLAVFQLMCTGVGVGWATVAGYGAALGSLAAIQVISSWPKLFGPPAVGVNCSQGLGRIVWRSAAEVLPWPRGLHLRLPGASVRGGSRNQLRRRLAHRCGFAPLVETIAW